MEEAILASQELQNETKVEAKEEEEEEADNSFKLSVRRQVSLSKDSHGIYSVKFSPEGHHLAVGFGNGAVQIVNPESGVLVCELFPGHRTRQAITALSYHPKNKNRLVATGADGIVSIYDLEKRGLVFTTAEEGNEINTLDFCRDGSIYATAGKDRHIRLYDSNSNQIMHILEAPNFMSGNDLTVTSGHTRRIFALRFHPDDYHYFLTGGWDDSVKIWDKRMISDAKRVISGPHICGPAIDVLDNKIVTGSWAPRDALQIWDFRTSNLEKNIRFPTSITQGEFLYATHFCNSKMVLAGGSGTNSACVIDYKTDKVIGEISLVNKTVQTVDSVQDGFRIAVAGAGGNLHIATL
uniref:Anaphase-promoting complex subunit 4 WD40 domain-containing protein n=1 Tax=Latimeria chalumnae TaxID=7897 RepID=H3AGS5_LATCH